MADRNIEEYIDKSKMIEANWESIFAQDGIEVGDLDSLRKSNKRNLRQFLKIWNGVKWNYFRGILRKQIK